MWVYYLVYGLSLVAVATAGSSVGKQRFAYYALLTGYVVFAGFRYKVGCDWWGYFLHYSFDVYSWSYAEILNRRESGYWLLLKWLVVNDFGYTWLNVATSVFFFWGLHRLARQQPNPLAFLVMAFPILVINMPMSGIRQGAGVGFLCMAFVAFNDRSLLRYVAYIMIGSLFHSSVIVFLLLAPFVVGAYSRSNIVLATLLALPGLVLLSGAETVEIAANRYIDTGTDARGAVFRLGVIAVSGMAFLLLADKPWKQAFPQDYKLAKLGSMMMVAALGLVFLSTVVADRLGYYLIPLQLMIFSRLPYLRLGPYQRWINSGPYVLLTLVFLVWTQFSPLFERCYVPYQIGFV